MGDPIPKLTLEEKVEQTQVQKYRIQSEQVNNYYWDADTVWFCWRDRQWLAIAGIDV